MFQSAIPATNWMYPARAPAAGLPAGYDSLIRPAKSLLLTPAEAESLRLPAIERWRAALSR